MYEKLIQYVLDPSIHLLKRFFMTIIVLSILFVVDEIFGFSEFYFEKSKAETISMISQNLKNPNIDTVSKSVIKKDLDKVVASKNYKERLGLFFDSIFNNRTIFIKDSIISNAPAPKATFKSAFSIVYSIFYVILFIASSNLLFILVLWLLLDKEEIRKNGRRKTVTSILMCLVCLVISACICIVIPPYYDFGNYWKLAFNFLYGFIFLGLVIVYDYSRNKREYKKYFSL